MEEWKHCFGLYEISSYGNLRQILCDGYKIVKGGINKDGYRYVQLIRDEKRRHITIHSLVAEVFIGERPNGYVIDHIDRDKLNNNLTNLRYTTHTINNRNTDRYRHDILSDDRKVRHRIFNNEYSLKTGRNRGIRRKSP